MFGFLKIVGLSPADDLARNFSIHMGAGAMFNQLFIILAVIECIIGLLFLFPRLTKIAFYLMVFHLGFVSSPIVLYPQGVWTSVFVPSLEGQYIIKNLALVALGIALLKDASAKRN